MIETERLILAPWTEAERAAFRAMSADPQVMHDYPAPWNEAQADARFERHLASFAKDSVCKWSLRRKSDGGWIGMCGINPIFPTLPAAPGLEIGWRMVRDAWGHGFATEAASAALSDAFRRLGVDEVISFTIPTNDRSLAVMQRLGLVREPERDFLYETGVQALVHVAYRADWR